MEYLTDERRLVFYQAEPLSDILIFDTFRAGLEPLLNQSSDFVE